ncbi:MAG: lipoprotein [Thermodesulfobacteriota bacterium]|nr:lipoprotein [Thermodesulfobacteriota bacterium]
MKGKTLLYFLLFIFTLVILIGCGKKGPPYLPKESPSLSLGACPRIPFFLNSLSCKKNYPRNINYIPAVIFFA